MTLRSSFSPEWMEAARLAVMPRFRHLDGGHPLVERLVNRAALDWLHRRGPAACPPIPGGRP
ncbi:MAG: hypothetical protein EA421_14695 [Gemmatimonadales bacterium]|nr:MAG: hypothetical protein EA421_14695 [Gemmatimonadales bacterium]